MLDEILAQCYANDGRYLKSDTRVFFFLVLAVSSRIGQVSQANLSSQAEAYFRSAVSDIRSGDVWRHLGFAIRHFFDLAHRPSMEEDEFHDILCTLTRTLYCLESALLQHNSQPVKGGASTCRSTAEESREYCRGLDEWFVRWKEFLETVPDDDDDGVSRYANIVALTRRPPSSFSPYTALA
ncbi:hypothetical protein CDV31_016077 [Fusarium ambrosium]|uniref:Uncharacterized protein n=1 Tax=Fusarium ambrosium TaxID=131363 RepID=A0A428SEX8_9HYPO|nr:hypothetical protein CDV31_016077 [Fusarium ambrosium]